MELDKRSFNTMIVQLIHKTNSDILEWKINPDLIVEKYYTKHQDSDFMFTLQVGIKRYGFLYRKKMKEYRFVCYNVHTKENKVDITVGEDNLDFTSRPYDTVCLKILVEEIMSNIKRGIEREKENFFNKIKQLGEDK